MLGEYNEEADLLFRWRKVEKEEQGDRSGSREALGRKEGKDLIVVNVSDIMDDYTWNILQSEHMGLSSILHKQRAWGLIASKAQLKHRLKNCETCTHNCRVIKDTKQGTMNNGKKPNDIVGMDFIGPMDNRYMLMIVEFLSQRMQMDVCKRADKESVLRDLCCWIQECRPVRCLIIDQGRHFLGDQLKEWCERRGVNKKWTHAYDHRNHGLVEQCNHSVLETLRRLRLAENNDRWWHLVQ